jgi:hypothetical protein
VTVNVEDSSPATASVDRISSIQSGDAPSTCFEQNYLFDLEQRGIGVGDDVPSETPPDMAATASPTPSTTAPQQRMPTRRISMGTSIGDACDALSYEFGGFYAPVRQHACPAHGEGRVGHSRLLAPAEAECDH